MLRSVDVFRQALWQRNDMLEESVIYQDILRKGRQQGEQKGAEREARKMVTLLLEQRVGKLSRPMQQKLEPLVLEQVEALCQALLDFQSKEDLTRWLKQHA